MGTVLRDYTADDFDAVKAIHDASQIDYKFPDLSSPLFLVTKVLEVDGVIRACGLLRIEAEAYLLLDNGGWGNGLDKFTAIETIQAEVLEEAWLKGIDNCVCWVPKEVNQSFAKRLVQLGWTQDRSGWISWSRPTK